jgi:hypothetical protein
VERRVAVHVILVVVGLIKETEREMLGRAKSIDALGVDQLLAALKALKHQLNATKRVDFSH